MPATATVTGWRAAMRLIVPFRSRAWPAPTKTNTPWPRSQRRVGKCPRGHAAIRHMRLIETSSEPRGHGLLAFAQYLRWLFVRQRFLLLCRQRFKFGVFVHQHRRRQLRTRADPGIGQRQSLLRLDRSRRLQ